MSVERREGETTPPLLVRLRDRDYNMRPMVQEIGKKLHKEGTTFYIGSNYLSFLTHEPLQSGRAIVLMAFYNDTKRRNFLQASWIDDSKQETGIVRLGNHIPYGGIQVLRKEEYHQPDVFSEMSWYWLRDNFSQRSLFYDNQATEHDRYDLISVSDLTSTDADSLFHDLQKRAFHGGSQTQELLHVIKGHSQSARQVPFVPFAIDEL